MIMSLSPGSSPLCSSVIVAIFLFNSLISSLRRYFSLLSFTIFAALLGTISPIKGISSLLIDVIYLSPIDSALFSWMPAYSKALFMCVLEIVDSGSSSEIWASSIFTDSITSLILSSPVTSKTISFKTFCCWACVNFCLHPRMSSIISVWTFFESAVYKSTEWISLLLSINAGKTKPVSGIPTNHSRFNVLILFLSLL